NPAAGATVFYRLATAPDSAVGVTMEFLDRSGAVVRRFSTDTAGGAGRLIARDGLHSLTWNLRRSAPTPRADAVLVGAPPGGGALDSPGSYQVRLPAGDAVRTQPLEVRQDPRLDVPAAVVAERDSVA